MLDPLGGEPTSKPAEIVQTVAPAEGEPSRIQSLKSFSPDDLIGKTYLCQPNEDGERFKATVVRKVIDKNESLEADRLKFLVRVDDKGEANDEILTYNELLDYLEKQTQEEADNTNGLWKFKAIVGHEGPLKPGHRSYKGSRYNVLIAWEDGSETSEPLDLIAADDPVTCALYAMEKGLLEETGWKRFKRLARKQKKLWRMANQAKLKSVRRGPIYKVG